MNVSPEGHLMEVLASHSMVMIVRTAHLVVRWSVVPAPRQGIGTQREA